MSAPVATLLAIDHVVLRCVHFQQTLDFYRDVLGCSLERARDDIGLYQLRAGSSLIDLVPVGGKLGGTEPPDSARANLAHFCLRVAEHDLEEVHARLAAAGVPADEPATRYGADGDGPSIYLTDPEGNVVELKAPVPG